MTLTAAAIEHGLIGHLLEVSYPPSRISDAELTGLRGAFDWLLDEHPDVHRRDPRVVEFHQLLITESDQRFSLACLLQIPGQLAFDDIDCAAEDGVEVPY